MSSAGQAKFSFHNSSGTTKELWTDKYTPQTESEIAVHPKKIKECRDAFKDSCIGSVSGRVKMLILSGPSGSGKSTLIRLLSRILGHRIVEWDESTRSQALEYNSVSQMDSFSQFIYQSIKTNTLMDAHTLRQKVILVDDIPDFTTESVRNQFHSVIRHCLNMPQRFLIVIVISEAWTEIGAYHQVNNETRITTVRDILPNDLVNDDRITRIEFNPVNKTLMMKALKLISEKEHLRAFTPQLDEIELISNGDIRFAINTLQFYSIPPLAKPLIPSKRKREKISEKSYPLSLFHALGKVLYAKRDEYNKLEERPQDVINKLPIDNDLFISYIHENCIPFFDNIEDISKCLDYLQEADTLRSKVDWVNDIHSDCRFLVSTYGVMCNRNSSNPGKTSFKRPDFFNMEYVVQQQLIKDRLASLMATVPEEKKDDILVVDEIETFSSDEYDEFDEIYGDGSDLPDIFPAGY
ncbi:Rad17 cell cycle checkpoint protein-domain-containing protein [Pilobolus umbonatus]|nr:Rad17 cell cycle checkpoint protein-domain-containing protein [Pilobolus umbonatus]